MRRRPIKWLFRALTLVVLLLGTFLLWRWAGGNFGTVEPGRVYRSAQRSGKSMTTTIRDYRIKTVLNLRGENPDQKWYRAEKSATLEAGAVQVDFPMASDQWLSRAQAVTLIEILDQSEHPILIHCEWGAERTGLVSAIVRLLEEGSTLEEARSEFSLYYLFLPMKDGLVMRGHLDLYEKWLVSRGKTHSPVRFREWLTHAYEPMNPSRQYWPCDLYPLKVVSRSEKVREVLWSESRCR